ncbi:hypothetical protein DVH05_010512, partial [Phytophthora capsici]
MALVIEQRTTVEQLRQEHSRLQRHHLHDIDKLSEKLSTTDEGAERACRLQPAENKQLRKLIDEHGRQIEVLTSSTRHRTHRKILGSFREMHSDQAGREKHGRKLTTKELIARVRAEKPHELSDWTLKRFSTESGYIHSRPTKKEALLVFDSNLSKDDAKYQEIFMTLFPESSSCKDQSKKSELACSRGRQFVNRLDRDGCPW